MKLDKKIDLNSLALKQFISAFSLNNILFKADHLYSLAGEIII